MTGAALLELVAIGAQDSILTCGAEITFFKHGYQKYTNYSTEVISNTFNGTPDFGQSNVRCQINRNADLVHEMWFKANISFNLSSTNFKWSWLKM